MLRDAAVARIKRRLKHREGTTIDSKIVDALQDAQRQLEAGGVPIPGSTLLTPFPWFLQSMDQTISVVASVQGYALPSGFIAEIDGHAPHYTPADSDTPLYLDKLRAETAQRTFVESGAPKGYEIRKSTIHFFPVPDQAYTLTWSYRAGDTILDTNATNQWLTYCPELLMGVAGHDIALDGEQTSAAAAFNEWITRGGAMLWRQNLEREIGANRRLAIGRLR